MELENGFDYSPPMPKEDPMLNYEPAVHKDNAWCKTNLAGLPAAFFEQMKMVESGELTKKMLRNREKKYRRKVAKQNAKTAFSKHQGSRH